MKGGLYIIYSSLVTVFILSSSAWYMLVQSVNIDTLVDINKSVDINEHLINEKLDAKEEVTLQTEEETVEYIKNKANINNERISVNSVLTTEAPNSITTDDNIRTYSLNDNKEQVSSDNKDDNNLTNKPDIINDTNSVNSSESHIEKSTLVVKAKPIDNTITETFELLEKNHKGNVFDNKTQDENKTETVKAPSEDIPSFSEWAQKQLAETETLKDNPVLNHSSNTSHTNNQNKNIKLRSKNYASPACGAKIVASNSEAGSANSILSPNRDEYMLNKCNSKIWFVVELCEAIQALNIEIANFELFSSLPKDFSVYLSNRFPTREWVNVGQFTARDERDIQSFELHPQIFGKYIKVELHSYYGSEHYCPISLFKTYGTSEFEVLEKENAQHSGQNEEEDEIIGDSLDIFNSETETTKNLFGSARDAVISIVKKAAEALVKSDSSVKNHSNSSKSILPKEPCSTPSYIIVCDNCSESLYNEVYNTMSCSSKSLNLTTEIPFVSDALRYTNVCKSYGLHFTNTKQICFQEERSNFLKSFYSESFLVSLCNVLAIIDKKVVLNVTSDIENSTGINVSLGQMGNNNDNVIDFIKVPIKDDLWHSELNINEKNILKGIEEKNTETSSIKLKLPVQEENSEKDVTETPITDITNNEKESSNINESIVDVELFESLNNKSSGNDSETEKVVNIPGTDNSTEETSYENDSYLPDIDQFINESATISNSNTDSQNTLNSQSSAQKESVFLRLSNRVKNLEKNMSLSSQYLEELSRRYKKQVEEMQKAFDKTVLQMVEERKRADEREVKKNEELHFLKSELEKLNNLVNMLVDGHKRWYGNINLLEFLFLQIIILAAVYYCKDKILTIPVTTTVKKIKNKKSQEKIRRKSDETLNKSVDFNLKKRRPSEEALEIACIMTEEKKNNSGKNKKRKAGVINKPDSNKLIPAIGRQDSIGVLQENIIPLDDEEFIAPVSEPKQFDPIFNEVAPLKELYTSVNNGLVLKNIKKTKSEKTRRLSSPAFFRSSLNRQSSKISQKSQNMKKTENENCILESTSNVQDSNSKLHNEWSGSETSSYKQSKRKSLKNIFKKVF